MREHTYSTVLYDVTWSDVGNALDTIQSIDNISGVDFHATYDTSGGTLDDGTSYDTEAVLTARYEYSLGAGYTALNTFADALSQLPQLPEKATIKDEITERG